MVLASSARSISERKVGILRRYGSPPGRCAVESALAMFSEITRMRPVCARRPDAAIAIDLRKSITALPCSSSVHALAHVLFGKPVPTFPGHALTLAADRSADQPHAAAVERDRRLVVHLVRGNLHHL